MATDDTGWWQKLRSRDRILGLPLWSLLAVAVGCFAIALCAP